VPLFHAKSKTCFGKQERYRETVVIYTGFAHPPKIWLKVQWMSSNSWTQLPVNKRNPILLGLRTPTNQRWWQVQNAGYLELNPESRKQVTRKNIWRSFGENLDQLIQNSGLVIPDYRSKYFESLSSEILTTDSPLEIIKAKHYVKFVCKLCDLVARPLQKTSDKITWTLKLPWYGACCTSWEHSWPKSQIWCVHIRLTSKGLTRLVRKGLEWWWPTGRVVRSIDYNLANRHVNPRKTVGGIVPNLISSPQWGRQ